MIRLENVTKTYPGGVEAVSNLSIDIQAGETLVLVGTSGSGKTTALKMINRLIDLTSGRIYIENRDIQHWDPIELRRRIGYVIQSIGLFPHMTVADNVALVPRLIGQNKTPNHARAAEVLVTVGLDPDEYLQRYPAELSGGQQQRVGVARALAADPPIILMDEPFGALDPITRAGLQQEFLDIKRRIRKTIVFVTHDISEAVVLGDRIAVMSAGKLEQVAPPDELITHPQTQFVSNFLGRQRFQLRLDAVKTIDVTDTSPASVAEAKQSQLKAAKSDSPLSQSLAAMADQKLSAIPVADANKNLIGLLRKDAALSIVRDLLNGDAS